MLFCRGLLLSGRAHGKIEMSSQRASHFTEKILTFAPFSGCILGTSVTALSLASLGPGEFAAGSFLLILLDEHGRRRLADKRNLGQINTDFSGPIL